MTLGAAVDLQSDSLKNSAFDMKTGAGLALWADYSAGGTAGTGWQASGALGCAHAKGTITRGRLLTNVVNAAGQSSLTTRAAEARIGYGIASGEGLVLTPSLTLAHVETRRPGYYLTQNTASKRPIYTTSGGLYWLESDGVDDVMGVASRFGCRRTRISRW